MIAELLEQAAQELDPSAIAGDLLEEVAEKNTVRVSVHRAVVQHGRVFRVEVMDELSQAIALLPALARQDELRMLAGKKPVFLDELHRRLGVELVDVVPNLRTTAGIDYASGALGNSGARPAVAEYIAVSADATAPAAGDTVVAGEISTNGLARAIATYAHTGAATNYTFTKTFTATGTSNNVQKAGLLNASSAGTLFLENTFTATSLVTNDQLTLTWTVNI